MALRRTLAAGLAGAIALAGLSASADDPPAAGEGAAPSATQAPHEEPVFGHQLMSKQDLDAYHAKMRAAKTPAEREKVIKEHHQRMLEIAKKRGITLQEHPTDTP